MPAPEPTPERRARQTIDADLTASGWVIQDRREMNVRASHGVAVREFVLDAGHGYADYLLFVAGRPVGAVEAKPVGHTLTGVEIQSAKYSDGVPDTLRPPVSPLPFLYETTGVETHCTNLLDPEPKARRVFAVHRPETLQEWLQAKPLVEWATSWRPPTAVAERPDDPPRPSSFRARVRAMPPLPDRDVTDLWPAQDRAIRNLEASLAANRQRALVQMATGSGKTFTAVSAIARLLTYAAPRRVLFLVDRRNLGEQAESEFRRYRLPWNNRLFTEEWNVQLLTSSTINPSTTVVITTIQRLWSILSGEPEPVEGLDEEGSQFDASGQPARQPVQAAYAPKLPPEFFELIFVDECHRSIYSVWGQVLTYFDAFLVGLTATPSNHTYGYFDGNVVSEYTHEDAVADGVNVDFEVYRIRTRIGEHGSRIEADGETVVRFRDRATRQERWEMPDDDIEYGAEDLDRGVVAVDQIRTVFRTLRDKLSTEIFPGRREVPKTLVFCKDDAHAEDVVRTVREVFGKGNDFAQKITYRTTGKSPRDLIQEFRTAYSPRVAVTVDMIATGTDIRPVEIVVFLRRVKSRIYFEQMKGRGVRVCDATELRQVTPDAPGAKDHFVIVDCVGACEQTFQDTQPLERKKSVSMAKLMELVAAGSTDEDVHSSLASRLARLDRQCGDEERRQIREVGGCALRDVTYQILAAIDPDTAVAEARREFRIPESAEPTAAQIEEARDRLLVEAGAPIRSNPALRTLLNDMRRKFEQVIDEVSRDQVIEAGFSGDARAKAGELVRSFEAWLAGHRDEFEALRFFYARPHGERLRYEDVKRLHEALGLADARFQEPRLWAAYGAQDGQRVRGDAATRGLADLVSLVKFAAKAEPVLVPHEETVKARFAAWLERQRPAGKTFTEEQVWWLERIRDHVAASIEITPDDFDAVPFAEKGGLAKATRLFGPDLKSFVAEINGELAA